MKSLSRSTALKIAAVISFLSNAFGIVFALPFVAQGATAATEGPPYFFAVLSLITGAVGVVAAYGTWKQQRWGIILTILANLVNGLGSTPGVLFAPRPELFVAATTGVVLSIVIIVLCLWRDRKLAAA